MGEGHAPRFGFTYLMCNDVEAAYRFYADVLAMKVIGHNEGRYFVVDGGGMEVIFFKTFASFEPQQGWAMQPGWEGGTNEVTSWSIQIPEDDYESTVDRLREAGTLTFTQDPLWLQDSYWGIAAKDPMGNTLEIYSIPKFKPSEMKWPGL